MEPSTAVPPNTTTARTKAPDLCSSGVALPAAEEETGVGEETTARTRKGQRHAFRRAPAEGCAGPPRIAAHSTPPVGPP